MKVRTVRFGLIGCGLMGREFASAAARWCHLPTMDVRPEIVGDLRPSTDLFSVVPDNFPTIRQVTADYAELLADPEVEAVYCAVPHHLHEQVYCAAIRAGKHLMGEKPFGIDQAANDAILDVHRRSTRVSSCAAARSSPSFPPSSGSAG